MNGFRSKRWIWAAIVALSVAAAILLSPATAEARKKRHPANNEICFDPALSAADRSDCKKQFADATTADERAKIRKVFKSKVDAAKSAPHG